MAIALTGDWISWILFFLHLHLQHVLTHPVHQDGGIPGTSFRKVWAKNLCLTWFEAEKYSGKSSRFYLVFNSLRYKHSTYWSATVCLLERDSQAIFMFVKLLHASFLWLMGHRSIFWPYLETAVLTSISYLLTHRLQDEQICLLAKIYERPQALMYLQMSWVRDGTIIASFKK